MVQHDAAGGVLLVVAALLALILANSPLSSFYSSFLEMPGVVRLGDFSIEKPLLLWINDGLMAIFFFLVGLEIKREILEGHLSKPSQIALPAIAAVAGIAFPALVYVALNSDDPVAASGWAIPSATDIAFALGVFSVFGSRLPVTLKLFLLSVAIFDDLGAIVIIAIFYSSNLSITSLTVAAIGLCVLFLLNRFSVRHNAAYIIAGMVVWAAVLKSGVHATLAGFAIALFIPLNVKNEDGHPMLAHMEHMLQPWVAFAILPVFAFANAGVSLLDITWASFMNPITLGIVLGLFVGKQLGIFTTCYIAVKLGLAKLPEGTNWLQLYAVSILCGIGFTMSLFIGTLAFEQQGLDYQASVKIGVLVGSLLSAIVGALVITAAKRRDEKAAADAYAEKPGPEIRA